LNNRESEDNLWKMCWVASGGTQKHAHAAGVNDPREQPADRDEGQADERYDKTGSTAKKKTFLHAGPGVSTHLKRRVDADRQAQSAVVGQKRS